LQPRRLLQRCWVLLLIINVVAGEGLAFLLSQAARGAFDASISLRHPEKGSLKRNFFNPFSQN
jgi:hypothetical protein